MQPDAKQASRPDHNVAEPAEIKVKLECVTDKQTPRIDPAQCGTGVIESRIDSRPGVQPSTHDRGKNEHEDADTKPANSGFKIVFGYGPILSELGEHA